MLTVMEQILVDTGMPRSAIALQSVGLEVATVDEQQLVAPGRYDQRLPALATFVADAPRADIAVLVTDGQPTADDVGNATCSPVGVHDLADLAPPIIGLLRAGRAVWLLFERPPFNGRLFPNCAHPSREMRSALPGLSCPPGRECWLAWERQPRTLLAIVVAAAEHEGTAARLVQGLVSDARKRSEPAAAIRLHVSPRDRWITAPSPTVRVVSPRAREPDLLAPKRNGDGARPIEWQAEVICPDKEAAVRVCIPAVRPEAEDGMSVLGRGEPAPRAGSPDVVSLSRGERFQMRALRPLRPWQYETCLAAWAEYPGVVADLKAPPADPACAPGGVGYTTEFVVMCGCLAHREGRSRARVALAQVLRDDTSAVLARLRREGHAVAPDRPWYEQLDRTNGVDAFLTAIDDAWTRPQSGGSGEEMAVLTLLIDNRAYR